APINWAIINGDTETGITTFFIDENIDTGRIIMQERIPIALEDCVEDIHDRMMERGALLVQQTVDSILRGEAKSVPQEQFMTDVPLRPAPKIFKETCQLQWDKLTLKGAYDYVRGLSPYPAAWAELRTPSGVTLTLKVFRTAMEEAAHTFAPGQLFTDGKTFLKVALPGGYLHLLDIQLNGKKRMAAQDFLRGARLQ
ncbi:MAG: methionyl-tRNA formyltransferase, partial [Bacteroidaceae bacterium]|nr:methionyl-tRNA formyltransferase [Bacteroidaceae bacterium]